MPRLLRTFLIAAASIAATLAVLFSTGLIQSNSGGAGETRVAVLKHDDGRVEVGLQAQTGDGWGERQLPDQRFLAANAPTNTWLASSGVAVSAVGEPDVYCVITHGHADDPYWALVEHAATERWGVFHSSVDIHYSSHPTAAGQSDAIRQCTDDGARSIAVTLADPDGVADAVAYAREHSVSVYSFNSGSNDHIRIGTDAHIGLDETAVGTQAAALFAAAGIDGPALCIIHEAANRGLEERCDGFEAAYAGSVPRLRVDESPFDAAATGQAIGQALGGIEAVFVLNAHINDIAVAAIQHPAVNSSAKTVSVGISVGTLNAVEAGDTLATFDDGAAYQISYILDHIFGTNSRLDGLTALYDFAADYVQQRFTASAYNSATTIMSSVAIDADFVDLYRQEFQLDPVALEIIQ